MYRMSKKLVPVSFRVSNSSCAMRLTLVAVWYADATVYQPCYESALTANLEQQCGYTHYSHFTCR